MDHFISALVALSFALFTSVSLATLAQFRREQLQLRDSRRWTLKERQ